jgi:hypothetical protein
VARATTLIRDACVSEAFSAEERERVFASGWVAAGCTESVRDSGDALATFGPIVVVNLAADPEPLGTHLCDLTERHAGYRLDEWVLAPPPSTASPPTTSSWLRSSWSATTCRGSIPAS